MTTTKTKLMVVIYLTVLIGIFVASYQLTLKINPLYLGLLWFIWHHLYILPKLAKKYSELANYNIGYKAYIPWINEVEIFSPVLAKVSLIILISCLPLVLIVILPLIGVNFISDLVSSIFGGLESSEYMFYILYILFALILLSNFVKGLAYSEMIRVLNAYYYNRFNAHEAKWVFRLSFIMVFFPMIRTISLSALKDRCEKLIVFGDVTEDKFI